MDLSVVIVSYNVRAFLEQCLVSVERASSGLDLEVWVVDNNSVDGSVEMVRSRFPEVHLVANRDNVGFSVANNQAIRQSKGEHVLLLNPDTVVREDTFVKGLAHMKAHPEVGGMGVPMYGMPKPPGVSSAFIGTPPHAAPAAAAAKAPTPRIPPS